MLTSRCTVVKANTRAVAQRATRPSCRVAVVNGKRQSPQVAAPAGDSMFRTTMAAGFAAASIILSNQPAFAFDALTGNTPSKQVGSTILEKDLGSVDNGISKQPNDAVKQGAQEVKDEVVAEAKTLKNEKAPNAQEEKQAAEGAQSQLAQLKSILGL